MFTLETAAKHVHETLPEKVAILGLHLDSECKSGHVLIERNLLGNVLKFATLAFAADGCFWGHYDLDRDAANEDFSRRIVGG